MSPQTSEANLKMLRISEHKLNYIAQTIRHKNVHEALGILKGMKKRAAGDVFKLVSSAIANAENNHGMDIEMLVVTEASVGKDRVRLRRTDFKGRSRTGRIIKQFSRMRVVLSEKK